MTNYFIGIIVLILIVISGVYYMVGRNKRVAVPSKNSTRCQSENLVATLSGGSGAAGTYVYTLGLKNNGSTECVYSGTTTISLRDRNKTALTRSSTTSSEVVIPPGQSIYAPVGFPDASNYTGADTCIAGITDLAVYPPSQTTAVTVTDMAELQPGFTNYACASFSLQSFSLVKPE